MKIKILIPILLIFFISCNPEGENGIPDTPSLQGEYRLSTITKLTFYKNGTNENELIGNQCINKSILSINSNNTFTLTNFTLDNNNCIELPKNSGTFSNILANRGNPYGDFSFDNGQKGTFFGSNDSGKVWKMELDYTKTENLPSDVKEIRYKYTFGVI